MLKLERPHSKKQKVGGASEYSARQLPAEILLFIEQAARRISVSL
jgi:hypothetical protein